MSAAKEPLKVAHARVAAAKAALKAAAAAAEKARQFTDRVSLEAVKHAKKNQELASRRAADLTQSLKRGAEPKFRASPKLASDHLARMEAENRATAAKQALHELVNEELSAQRELDEAVAELQTAARASLARVAEEHAERIAELEGEAFQHRIQLEGASRSGAFGYRPISLNDLSKRILIENNSLPFGTRMTEPWVAANASAEDWRQRLSRLMDPALSA
jgi:hypothetical protein